MSLSSPPRSYLRQLLGSLGRNIRLFQEFRVPKYDVVSEQICSEIQRSRFSLFYTFSPLICSYMFLVQFNRLALYTQEFRSNVRLVEAIPLYSVEF